VFISAIQALKLVERDATDGAVTTAFNDVASRSTNLSACIADINTALACLDASTAVVLEDTDLSAPWQAQLALTDSALITANTVVSNAASVMNSDAELSSKTTSLQALLLMQ
jgi:hypothetical protein